MARKSMDKEPWKPARGNDNRTPVFLKLEDLKPGFLRGRGSHSHSRLAGKKGTVISSLPSCMYILLPRQPSKHKQIALPWTRGTEIIAG